MSRLKPVPKTPNCVSSRVDENDKKHGIAPLVGISLTRIKLIMAATPGARLIYENESYLHYEITTSLLRFKDDLEFELDDDVVHVRSASRVGYSDFGANRKRVEQLRKWLTE